jgi:nucleoside-diphosphate-sugar epimerase
MRVIVTGSRGFIGRELVRRLREGGAEVLCVGRKGSPAAPRPRAPWHDCDVADPASYLPAGFGDAPFTLAHLAWDTRRPPHFRPHAEQTLWLARWCDYWTGRGLKAVVMPGTAEEYGQRAGTLHETDAPLGRLSAYGWGKAMARSLLQTWSTATGATAWWLRLFLVYGPGQEGNMVVPYAVGQLLRGQRADFSDGLQQRDFVYIDDVTAALEAAVRSPRPGFHVVNVGTGRPVAVRAVLERLGELLGARECLRFGAIPRRPGEPPSLAAATGQAARLLRWRAAVDWREGVEQLANSLRKNQAWAA